LELPNLRFASECSDVDRATKNSLSMLFNVRDIYNMEQVRIRGRSALELRKKYVRQVRSPIRTAIVRRVRGSRWNLY